MNFTRTDLKYLRAALITLFIAVSIGGGAVWGANYLRVMAEKENKVALAKRAEAQSKLERVSHEQQELTEKILLFQDAVKRGYTKAEDRLDWIERLDRIQKSLKIADFQYEFSVQRPVGKELMPSGASAGGYDFLISMQNISMNVLHEGDVWNFIHAIKRQVGALVIVQSCTFERLPIPAVDTGTGPYLSAACVLDWITLKESS